LITAISVFVAVAADKDDDLVVLTEKKRISGVRMTVLMLHA